ncbi:MAG TPA: ribosome-associated translation inhibitor RaiA [Candidatus Polarisedimenticolia bacterium]|nr:ribosome-associated translation inhibitor RaiA [Candidatus Polarisedimenticolia bacterium]
MKVLFTGRKAHLTLPLKSFTEEKLGKLERLFDGIHDAHVILTLEKHRRLAEIVLKTRHSTFSARADTTDFRDSVGECVDRLVAQTRKHHERLVKEAKRRGARAVRRGAGAVPPAAEAGAPISATGNEAPTVVRLGRIPVKPMSVQEAVLQARGSRDPFVVFRNAESLQVSILVRREDGEYGLFEAEA